jgi:hypothetical protein
LKKGEHQWDTNNELRTRLELSLRLPDGHIFFTAGKTPLATVTLKPDGKTLDVTIRADRLSCLLAKKGWNKL